MLQVPPDGLWIANNRQRDLSLNEIRVGIRAGEACLFLGERPDFTCAREEPTIGRDVETVVGKAFSSVMRLTGENHRLALNRQLESGSSIDRNAAVEQMKELERTDFLFR